MPCESVRIALAAGEALSREAEAHLAGCPGCTAARRVVGMPGPPVAFVPLVVPAPAAFRRRERRWIAGRVALAAAVALLIFGVAARRGAAPAHLAVADPATTPRGGEVVSLDFDLMLPDDPLGDAELDLGADLDPLSTLDSPTDLLEHALSGEGRL